MTIATETNRISAVGSGSTGQEVPFTFPISVTSDVTVYKLVTSTGIQTTLAEITNYTIAISGTSGGTLTTVTTIEATEQIHIVRNTPNIQSLDLVLGGSFSPEAVEAGLDKLTKLTTENVDGIGKSLRFPATDSSSLTTILPSSVGRASKALTFDSSGNATAAVAVPTGSVSFTTFGTNMAEAADALAGRTVLGVPVYAADDYSTFEDAIDAIGATEATLVISGSESVTNDKTVLNTTELLFLRGGALSVATGKTVTIKGEVTAGDYIIFAGAGTVTFSQRSVINCVWYASSGDGIDTFWVDALRNALAAQGSGTFRTYFLPGGQYEDASTMTYDGAGNFNIIGAGIGVTLVHYAVADTSSMWKFLLSTASKIISKVKISNMTFDGDNTAEGAALEFIDCTECAIENIFIDDWKAANTSTGIWVKGRDSFSFRNVEIEAKIGILLDVNPNHGTLDIDHFSFHNIYIKPADATNGFGFKILGSISELSTSGFIAIATTKYGVYWVPTADEGRDSWGVDFFNIRVETGNTSAWAFYIDLNTKQVRNVSFTNCIASGSHNGWFLRDCFNVVLNNCQAQAGATFEGIDASDTILRSLTLINCWINGAATANASGLPITLPAGVVPAIFIGKQNTSFYNLVSYKPGGKFALGGEPLYYEGDILSYENETLYSVVESPWLGFNGV